MSIRLTRFGDAGADEFAGRPRQALFFRAAGFTRRVHPEKAHAGFDVLAVSQMRAHDGVAVDHPLTHAAMGPATASSPGDPLDRRLSGGQVYPHQGQDADQQRDRREASLPIRLFLWR